MSTSEERIQQALAAHLEHRELGGPEPDLSHLTDEEREQLHELIDLLDQTEGVAIGRALEPSCEDLASTEAGERLVEVLRDGLPPSARIARDPAAAALVVEGVNVVEAWTVGTFGGRIRVWLLADDGALASSDAWLLGLERAFRLLPDTAALALVEPDLSCLLVQPEDCAPRVEVPAGSLAARRYRRPVAPVAEALSVFVRELIPTWEPMQPIDATVIPAIDVGPITVERAGAAVQEQAAAGARARKANPKRAVLTAFGEEEAAAIAELALGVHDGRMQPNEVDDALRRLASQR